MWRHLVGLLGTGIRIPWDKRHVSGTTAGYVGCVHHGRSAGRNWRHLVNREKGERTRVKHKARLFHGLNLLAHVRCGSNYGVISKHMLQIKFMSTSCGTALRIIAQSTFDKTTLVQVMAWCHQAPSHYLSQCWPRSMSPYGALGYNELPHCGLVMSYDDRDQGQHWLR